MSRLRPIGRIVLGMWHRAQLLALAVGCWLALHGEVLAASKKAAVEEPAKPGGVTSWTMPYGLVIMLIGLGMLFVCRPSRRRDRAKPQVYEGQAATK